VQIVIRTTSSVMAPMPMQRRILVLDVETQPSAARTAFAMPPILVPVIRATLDSSVRAATPAVV
jgi:hypothetical protein